MKVILLFALFGLSFYQVSGHLNHPPPRVENKSCKVTPVNYDSSSTCLKQTMQGSTEFLIAVTDFLYEYKSRKNGGDYQRYSKAVTEMTETLKCTGCELDLVLSTDNAMPKLLEEVAQDKEGVGAIAKRLVESLGVDEKVADALCILLNGVLKSECMQKKLRKIAPAAMANLSYLYCKRETNSEENAAFNIVDVLKGTGCTVDELLPPEQSLEGLLNTVSEVKSSVAGAVLEATEQIPLAKPVLCDLLNGGGIDELLAGLKKGLLEDVLQGVLGGVKGLLGGLPGGSI